MRKMQQGEYTAANRPNNELVNFTDRKIRIAEELRKICSEISIVIWKIAYMRQCKLEV